MDDSTWQDRLEASRSTTCTCVPSKVALHAAACSQAAYERGFSFLCLKRANKETPETLTTLKRTPGISPTACPERPKPAMSTSSFSSMKFKQPSLGTNAAIFFPFLISCTRAHLRMAELGCLASIPLRLGKTEPRQSASLGRRRETRRGVVFGAGIALDTHIFSSTIPLACEDPANGFFHSLPKWLFL